MDIERICNEICIRKLQQGGTIAFPSYNNTQNYVVSPGMQRKIRTWEGSTMSQNKSFVSESRKALSRINPKVLNMLSPQQLDSLISYSYHVPGKYARVIAPMVNGLQNANSYQDLVNMERNISNNFHTKSERTSRGLAIRHNYEINNFINGIRQPQPQVNEEVPDNTRVQKPDMDIIQVNHNPINANTNG